MPRAAPPKTTGDRPRADALAAPGEPASKRRRRTPQAAEREIVEAAESFLRQHPYRELSVDEVMARTSLARSSFYVYYRDRHALVLRLVEEIGDELFAMAKRWLAGTGDAHAELRRALEGVAAVYAAHGPVLRAIADAASVDPEVEAVYNALIQRFVDATTTRIESELEAGRTRPLDAQRTAHALCWMTERHLSQMLGLQKPLATRETIVETMYEIWVRVLYGG